MRVVIWKAKIFTVSYSFTYLDAKNEFSFMVCDSGHDTCFR